MMSLVRIVPAFPPLPGAALPNGAEEHRGGNDILIYIETERNF
jgi:hypothetical protein